MTNDTLSDPDSTRELTALLLATDTFESYVQQVVELPPPGCTPDPRAG